MRRAVLGAAVAAVGALGAAGSAGAVPFTELDARFHAPDTAGGPGAPLTQAGARSDVTFNFMVPGKTTGEVGDVPADRPHRMVLKLPRGLVGNPQAVPTCPETLLKAGLSGNFTKCPAETQVGMLNVWGSGKESVAGTQALYNVEAPKDAPGQFAANVQGHIVRLIPTVDPDSYAVVMDSGRIPQGHMMAGATVTMWGVPSDPIHDYQRYSPAPNGTFSVPSSSGAPPNALLALPTHCNGPALFTASLDGWDSIGQFTVQSFSETADGDPLEVTGCDVLDFRPAIEVAPSTTSIDAPSGLAVDLAIPQSDDPGSLAAAHVKDVRMVLPEGVSVSPSSAVGLDACSPAQIGIGSDAAPTCPRASKLGTVSVETPVLERPLSGDVFLAAPYDNPFGSLIALYISAEGSGVRVKLPGRVDPDPVTGRLTATFENNPQLPFSALRVRFDGGDNASLATPIACGRYETRTSITSWSGKAADLISPTVVDRGCGPRGFAPSFVAGVENPVAGALSGFSLAMGREDRSEEIDTIKSLKLPEGLLGRVGSVPLCGDADADAGTCPNGSRIGHVQVAAGPGGSPLWLPQQGKTPTTVSMAGPYRGAPYSLSVVVPAQAGPFDLGRVVVRSALHLDRTTAQLSTGIDESRIYAQNGTLTKTIQGAMPSIVEGIPLRLRDMRVLVDRPGFMVNPTSCAPKSIDATLAGTAGQTADVKSRFEVGDCQALGFTPKLAMRLTGKRQAKTGGHPGLRAVLTQPAKQANIAKAQVTMPKAIVLDPSNSVDPALVCDYDRGRAADCPASSVIGTAKAVSPLLRKPLAGDVHLVQGIRFGPTGNRIRTTPSLLVKLRGEVALDLRGTTTVRDNRLVTTFGQVPDAPVSRFDIDINGGKKGILVVTRTRKAKINLCAKPNGHSAGVALDGQNGRNADYNATVKTPCAKAKKAKKTGSKRS